MLQGIVIGHATSTIKHPSLTGWRLAIVQPVGPDGKPDTDPVVAVDSLGASAVAFPFPKPSAAIRSS